MFCAMQKTTIFVTLAMVALVSSGGPCCSSKKRKGTAEKATDSKTNFSHVIDLLDSLNKIDIKMIDINKLINKKVTVNGKEVDLIRIVKLIQRIKKVDWKFIGTLLDKKQVKIDHDATVNGKKVNMIQTVKILQGIGGIDWNMFDKISACSTGVPGSFRHRTESCRHCQETMVRGEDINLPKIAELLESVNRIDWEKFDATIRK